MIIFLIYYFLSLLSFGDVVSPVGVAAHHVRGGRILIVSVGRVCTFFATVRAVSVSPTVLWSGWI